MHDSTIVIYAIALLLHPFTALPMHDASLVSASTLYNNDITFSTSVLITDTEKAISDKEEAQSEFVKVESQTRKAKIFREKVLTASEKANTSRRIVISDPKKAVIASPKDMTFFLQAPVFPIARILHPLQRSRASALSRGAKRQK